MSEQNIPNPDPRRIAELLANIRAGQEEMERALDGLTSAEMTEPGPDGGWSVKDHLAHLIGWRRMLLSVMRGRPRWEGFGLPPELVENSSLDSLNDVLYRTSKDEPLQEVLAGYRSSTAEIMAQLTNMKESDLDRPFHPQDPNNTTTLKEEIVYNTYGHDLEHLEWIGEMLKTRSNRKRDLE